MPVSSETRDDLQPTSSLTAEQIRAMYQRDWYTGFHAYRYANLLLLLHCYMPEENPQRILDVGPSKLTELIHEQFQLPVDSLGFGEDRPTPTGYHYRYDLNETQQRERWRTNLPTYDVVVMGEVLEHLFTPPTLVLSFLKSLLKPSGLLLLQTPNAAKLSNRLRLLVGVSPFRYYSDADSNPEHFREYTERELYLVASMVGFEVRECLLSSHFDYRYASHKQPTKWDALRGSVVNAFYRRLPWSLRAGMTFVMSPTEQELAR